MLVTPAMIGVVDNRLGEAIAAVRKDPAAEDSRELLRELLAEVAGDLPEMTSVDAGRVRALARLLDDTAQHQRGAERAQAKEAAAAAERVAAFLAMLGRVAGDPDAW